MTVSARELYEFLGATERFQSWFDRQLGYGFEERADYLGCKVFNTLAKQELQDYSLTLECAKSIGMIQRSEKGMQIRNYFIDCEKKLQLELQSKTPTNFAQALLLAYEQQLIIDKQSLELEEAQPKLKAFERVIDGSTTYTLDSVSDAIDVGRTTLSKVLKEIGWAMKDSKSGTSSTRMAEDNRYAKTVFDKIEINGKEVKFKKIVITKRGLDYLIKNFEKIF